MLITPGLDNLISETVHTVPDTLYEMIHTWPTCAGGGHLSFLLPYGRGVTTHTFKLYVI